MYLDRLTELDREGRPIRVALVGAGAMGVGIAWQVAHTPGMKLVSVTDIDIEAAVKAAGACGRPYAVVSPKDRAPAAGDVIVTQEPFFLTEESLDLRVDVLVEATNTIDFAGRLCIHALERRIHVVLMNAEVDLALGPLLHDVASRNGVIVTSDAGDQHGVLMRMIDEIRLWGFRIVMAGNIKGYLDRSATPQSVAHEAKIRNLAPIQCCAYTDGTKLNIEMALIANGTGLVPWVPGMEGPPARHVSDVFRLFDFSNYGQTGVVDYILGAEPGGGVFVVGHCDDPRQVPYLSYYKLGGGPYYLFYRPYHLCHLETPRAIAQAVLDHRPILWPAHGRLTDVYAVAKRDLVAGEVILHAIGGDAFNGRVDRAAAADSRGEVPITMLDASGGGRPRMTRNVAKGQPIRRDDIELPDTFLIRKLCEQAQIGL